MDKQNVGFIGCGGIAVLKHFPALMKQKHRIRLMAFCDLIQERADRCLKDFGDPDAKTYIDYRKLLEDASLDIVYVATPNVSHSKISIAALEAGKHVMCEKPMAIDTAEAQAMLDASRRTGKKLTIAYQNRFRNDSQILYRACQAGDLGDIYFGRAHAVRRRGVPTWGVFADKDKQGGGPLIDIGTHALDLTLWMMNNYQPKTVLGSVFKKMRGQFEGNEWGPWDPASFGVEDSAFGLIKMENGATIYLEAAWALNVLHSREGQITLVGTEAGAEMMGDGAASPTSPVSAGRVVFNFMKYGAPFELYPSTSVGADASYQAAHGLRVGDREQEAWLDAIFNNTEVVVKPEQALLVTKILDAIYKSAAAGKAVDF